MRPKSKFFLIGAVFAAASAAVIVAPTLTLAGIEEEEKKKDDEKKKSEAQIQKEAETARTTREVYARGVRIAEGMWAAAEREAALAQEFYDASRRNADNAPNNRTPLTQADLDRQAGAAKAALDAAVSERTKAFLSFRTASEALVAKQTEADRAEQAAINARKANEAKNKFAQRSAATTQQQSATSSAVAAEDIAPVVKKVGAAFLSKLERTQQAAQRAQQGGPAPVPDPRLKPSRQNQAAGQAGAPNAIYDDVTDVFDYQNASTSQQKQ